MKISMTFLLGAITCFSLCAQDSIPDLKNTTEFFPEASGYIELGGNGLLYSLNFEQVIFKKNNVLTSRIGASYIPAFGEKLMVIPLEVNYLIGRKRTSVELGTGIDFLIESYYEGRSVHVRYIPRVGFRRYNSTGDRYIRFGCTPILDKSIFGLEPEGWLHTIWFGFGFGFIIKK